MKFRKKPVAVEIEAVQWSGHNTEEIMDFVGNKFNARLGEIYILTPQGEQMASRGDFIIKGTFGGFYPCKPDIFAATYEAVK